MFDPSKLDLDLNNKTEKNNTIKKDIIPQKEKIENLKIKDPLDTLSSSQIEENNKEIQKIEKSEEENTISEKENIVSEEEIWKTEYEKDISKLSKETEEKKQKEESKTEEEKIIFDINITSIDIILAILVDNDYDFVIFEPSEDFVKIIFRKDKVIKETKYIKYPIYSNILIKAKVLTKLTIEETKYEQDWTWEVVIRNKNYKMTAKVVPTTLWSKLFIKTNYIEKKIIKKENKKIAMSKILWFLWIIAFIALVIWGAFITFIVLNAKTIDDVKFFYSLWINLNDINNFIGQALSIIFSILIFIETIFLIIFLFKFGLTKKEFKKKKIKYWIFSAIILLITFFTASTWMIIDKKVRDLPNWQTEALGDIQIYDNSKLISEKFDKQWSILQDTSNLIWPVQIKFDLGVFTKKEHQKWFTIKKFIWDFWNGEIKETSLDSIIYNFKEKWNYNVSLQIQELNLQWEIIEKTVDNIPNINISYVVNINEKKLNNWWKLVDFNASSLKELGKAEWYFMDNLDKPVWKWETFIIWKPIFEETLIWMYIRRNDKESDKLDKLFIISWEDKINLDWKIIYNRWLINDLEYEIQLKDIQTDFWNWYIEEYKWIIWNKEITNVWDVDDPEWSSKIKYEFKSYWKHEIKVIIKDSSWETKEIFNTIDISKQLKLNKKLRIFNNWKLLDEKEVKYENKLNEYYINKIWVPNELTLDARFIKANNLLYTLKEVKWDYNSDGDIDEIAKTWKYQVNQEWNHTITVFYEFVHRKISDDSVILKEQIFIEWLKKEAIINFEITKNSNYVPVVVSFDASKSQVKNEDIDKFIWDYDDWIKEERDAVVPWHKYTVPWDYEIKLKVVTVSWKEYSSSKKLILKPKPQNVEITASIKNAPIWQWIDFSSEDSEGQIIWYLWDFWDWNISTSANPTHAYSKVWEYKVKLTLDFSNKNILEDIVIINVYEE
jgi:PKD repeat protein